MAVFDHVIELCMRPVRWLGRAFDCRWSSFIRALPFAQTRLLLPAFGARMWGLVELLFDEMRGLRATTPAMARWGGGFDLLCSFYLGWFQGDSF